MRPKFATYHYEDKKWRIHSATTVEIATGDQGIANGRFDMVALCGASGDAEVMSFDEPWVPRGGNYEDCAECAAKLRAALDA